MARSAPYRLGVALSHVAQMDPSGRVVSFSEDMRMCVQRHGRCKRDAEPGESSPALIVRDSKENSI
jgi:hypothetical protein